MPKPGKQAEMKRNRQARAGSTDGADNDGPLWEPSPELEIIQHGPYRTFLGGTTTERLAVRMGRCLMEELQEFAIWQETAVEGRWTTVTVVDTRHGTVHRHWYGAGIESRIGDPEVIKPLRCRDDVEDGYSQLHRQMTTDWELAKERWQYGTRG